MLDVPDVHCHLDGVVDPDGAVDEAAAAGVGPILAVGMQEATSARALELRARHPERVRAAVGLHPSEIPALDEPAMERELEFVRATLAGADALGEVGLDHRDATDDRQRARQREALGMQLEWAAVRRKPVSLHCRRAEREIVAIATEFAHRTGLGVNLHWFTHSEKLARRCAEAGLYISPGPSILFDQSQARVAAVIADAGLLLETDSPVAYGGEPARPAWAARVAARLAALRGMTPEALAELLQANFRRYMGGAG